MSDMRPNPLESTAMQPCPIALLGARDSAVLFLCTTLTHAAPLPTPTNPTAAGLKQAAKLLGSALPDGEGNFVIRANPGVRVYEARPLPGQAKDDEVIFTFANAVYPGGEVSLLRRRCRATVRDHGLGSLSA
jgi:hypothetical protein